jgi:hypothetical protein
MKIEAMGAENCEVKIQKAHQKNQSMRLQN